MSRSVQAVFEQYRIQRHNFAAQVSELALKPECIEQLMKQGAVLLLRNLQTDSVQAIQQNAVTAIGRLAGHSPEIAELILRQDIVRILFYFNMDKSNKYLKKASLLAVRNIVRHSPELSKSVMDIGFDKVVEALEDFDPGVKEAAAWVCGCIARHDLTSAYSIISAGAVPLLILCLQEPEVAVRAVASSALSDVCKHSPETSQTVLESGAIIHLVRALDVMDPKLQRQALNCLASIAKHSLHMAELIVEAGVIAIAIKLCGHIDELVRRAACAVLREVVKHSSEMAQLVFDANGVGVIIDAISRNRGDSKLPGIMTLGYMGGQDPALSKAIIDMNGAATLTQALGEDSTNGNVAAASAWALGHIACKTKATFIYNRSTSFCCLIFHIAHSPEHARSVSLCGLLPKILDIYMNPKSSEEIKVKTRTALKVILFKIEDLECVEPLLSKAPFEIMKYVVALYSKILPKDPAARRAFVVSRGLQKLQVLLNEIPKSDEYSILRDHIELINQCYPQEVVKYFSPDYPETLLERVEQFRPMLNIDPSLWSDRLFSGTQIPGIQDEILALQKQFTGKGDLRTSGDLTAQNGITNEEELASEEDIDVQGPPPPPPTIARKSITNANGKKKSVRAEGSTAGGDSTLQGPKLSKS